MADTKISALSAASALDGAELVPVVQGGATVRAAASAIAALGAIQSATVVLTAEDIAALGTTPFELVAAQGAGKAVFPLAIAFVTDDGVPPVKGFDNGVSTIQWEGADPYSILGAWAAGGGSWAAFLVNASPSMSAVQIVDVTDMTPSITTTNASVTLSVPTVIDGGALATVTINNGGTGYAVGDTGWIGSAGDSATYEVTSESGGVVTGVDITAGGTQYGISETGLSTTTLSGTGDGALTLDVDTCATGTKTLTVTTYYVVLDV